jgi:RNA polymerase sigma factor (sigma-70 family)
MPDDAFLKEIRAGQKPALHLLYTEYRKKFIQLMTGRYTRDVESATEIYQAAITIVYENIMNEKLSTLNHENSLWNYIFKTGVNIYNDLNRRQKRITEFTEDYFDTLPVDLEDGEAFEQRASLEDEKVVLLRRMQEALEQLGDPCGKLLDLYYFEKKSIPEIVAALNYINSDSAKTQKYKCIKRLRKLFFNNSKNNQ